MLSKHNLTIKSGRGIRINEIRINGIRIGITRFGLISDELSWLYTNYGLNTTSIPIIINKKLFVNSSITHNRLRTLYYYTIYWCKSIWEVNKNYIATLKHILFADWAIYSISGIYRCSILFWWLTNLRLKTLELDPCID